MLYDIDQLMPTDLITLDEPPAEKEAAIESLLDVVVDAGRVDDREAALAALLDREEETTTGVGKGIAIPHAQTDAIDQASVALDGLAIGNFSRYCLSKQFEISFARSSIDYNRIVSKPGNHGVIPATGWI